MENRWKMLGFSCFSGWKTFFWDWRVCIAAWSKWSWFWGWFPWWMRWSNVCHLRCSAAMWSMVPAMGCIEVMIFGPWNIKAFWYSHSSHIRCQMARWISWFLNSKMMWSWSHGAQPGVKFIDWIGNLSSCWFPVTWDSCEFWRSAITFKLVVSFNIVHIGSPILWAQI